MPKRKLDPLPSAAFQILLSLAEADLHGYGIMRQVADQTKGRMRLGPGTLYSSIQSLLEEKLIEEISLADSESDRDRRRIYRLCPAGRKLARKEADRLADLLRVARAKNILRGNMSEKVYVWLLFLFPAGFRKAYGRDALQLFRDRWRDEPGLFFRVRLWADLLVDLIVALPQEYRYTLAARDEECSCRDVGARPRFNVLAADRIGPTSLLLGGLITTVSLVGGLGLVSPNLSAILIGVVGAHTTAHLQNAHGPIGVVGLPSLSTLRQTRSPDAAIAWLLTFISEGVPAKRPSSLLDPETFVTISVKPSPSADPRNERMRVLPTGDLIARGVSVLTLLTFAYDVPANPSPLLSGLPDWSLERYDIEAKAAAHAIPSGLRGKEALHRAQEMIRRLLAGRFGIVMQVDKRRMSVYALSLASGGPRLNRSHATEEACLFDTDPEGCHSFVIGFGHPLRARAVNMDDLAHYIENWTDLPVVNRTGLGGLFALSTGGWTPMRLPPPPPGTTPNPSVFAQLPTIFAILADLGLTLDRKEASLPVYSVERIERPVSK